MSTRSLSTDDDALRARFRRYARVRDPEDLAAVFDGTAPRLLRVALHVAPDAATAEDLVQATFVTAMERAEHFDDARPILPWLTGILEHHARRARSRAARRPDPERLPGPKDVVDPVRVAHDREFDAELRRALDALPDADRTVLVLALRHGLTPVQIADALGEAPGTVRVRLHRARARLRGRLPSGIASAGVGLASVRARVVELAAAQVGPSGVGIATTLGLVTTMKTVSWKIPVFGAVLVLVGAAAVWLGDLVGDSGAPPDLPVAEVGAVTGTNKPTDSGATAEVASPQRGAAERRPVAGAVVDSSRPSLFVRVSDPEGVPVAGERITLEPVDGRLATLHAREAQTDAGGVARFAAIDAGVWAIHADRGPPPAAEPEPDPVDTWVTGGVLVGERDGVPIVEAPVVDEVVMEVEESVYEAEVDARERQIVAAPGRIARERDFELKDPKRWRDAHPPLARVTVDDADVTVDVAVAVGRKVSGVVVDPDGTPVAGAEVFLRTGDVSIRQLATTGDDGRFDGVDVPAGSVLLFARAPGRAMRTPVRSEAEEIELQVGPQRIGGTIVGRVVDAGDRPVKAAQVRVDVTDSWRPPALARSDDDGRFRIEELPDGHLLVRVLAPGHEPWQAWTAVGGGETREFDVRLAPGWRAHGRVLDTSGGPQEGVEVRAAADGRPTVTVVSGADGRYAIDCLPVGDVAITVPGDDDHLDLEVSLRGAAGDAQQHDLVRRPTLSIRGEVVDERGEPLYPWRVLATAEGGDRETVVTHTRIDGSFRVVTEPGRRYRLALQPDRLWALDGPGANGGEGPKRLWMLVRDPFIAEEPGVSRVDGAELGLDVQEAETSGLRIVVPPAKIPSARLRGRAVDASGGAIVGHLAVRCGDRRTGRSLRDGVFDTGMLMPGEYEFRIVPRGSHTGPVVGPPRLEADARIDLGTVTIR